MDLENASRRPRHDNDNNKSTIDDLTDIDSFDPSKVLYNIRQKHSNRLIIAQLNINSLRNKFSTLSAMIKNNIDILLLSETKIDTSFPTAQFHIDGFTIIDVTGMKMEAV